VRPLFKPGPSGCQGEREKSSWQQAAGSGQRTRSAERWRGEQPAAGSGQKAKGRAQNTKTEGFARYAPSLCANGAASGRIVEAVKEETRWLMLCRIETQTSPPTRAAAAV